LVLYVFKKNITDIDSMYVDRIKTNFEYDDYVVNIGRKNECGHDLSTFDAAYVFYLHYFLLYF
jgi:hypothetical protein